MIYKIIRKSRWKFIKISRIYFNSIYSNTQIFIMHNKYVRAVDWLLSLRKGIRAVGGKLQRYFYRRTAVSRLHRGIIIRQRMLNKSMLLGTNFINNKQKMLWLLRLSQLHNRIFYGYKCIDCGIKSYTSTIKISRKDIRGRYLLFLEKTLDDSIIKSAIGFKMNPIMESNSWFFEKMPHCHMLNWYYGIKFGAFVSFRVRYRYKYVRDRRRKKKIMKDYKKKVKKFEHSVRENLRLVSGKRRKPKKKHIVYYK